MSDQPHNGVGRLRYKVWLWIIGAALVVIVLTIVLLILPSQIATLVVPNALATYIFFGIGLEALCVYTCVTWLRRQFPFNWIICGIIAALLSLGTVSILPEQEPLDIMILSEEILFMMVLLLLFGSYRLPNWPTIAQLFIGWYIFAVVASFITVVTFNFLTDRLWGIKMALHLILWEALFPVIVFQGQIISGYWNNDPPHLDKPLCSLMLLLDFLACFVFLSCIEDIGTLFHYIVKPSSRKFFNRLIDVDDT
ncbi:uncharacterized protein LOC110186095 [Drosophila serrata]|uniref:uncharacterized protein LOC110186095 n=1 Tax=Drosophila serrata TaxID=7274 RepID=UPI000A1D2F24|nr:uncharacterized protein LOC110186095 [Drosophila serrata]